jgi:catalase-peroxidase
MLVDKAQLLTAPEMTVLVGGMRVLNTRSVSKWSFHQTSRALNDFFVNLLDLEQLGKQYLNLMMPL